MNVPNEYLDLFDENGNMIETENTPEHEYKAGYWRGVFDMLEHLPDEINAVRYSALRQCVDDIGIDALLYFTAQDLERDEFADVRTMKDKFTRAIITADVRKEVAKSKQADTE